MNNNSVVLKQKEVLANFFANFALAWFSFGLISPIYNQSENSIRLILGGILSLIFGGFALYSSVKILK